jgi:hypothetical protein
VFRVWQSLGGDAVGLRGADRSRDDIRVRQSYAVVYRDQSPAHGPRCEAGRGAAHLDPHFRTDDSGRAIAFAGYFFRALDWSIATTNANLLRAISAPSCSGCQEYIQQLDRFAATGKHSIARLSVSAYAPVTGHLEKADLVIQVTVSQQPDVLVNADGSSETNGPALVGSILYLYMDWQNGSFVALDLSHP